MACYEVSAIDEVRALNGAVAETQVRNGDTTTLFGVVYEVTLSVLVGVSTNNLDAVLVSTNGTVGTKTIELTADCTSRSCVYELVKR